MPNFDYGKNGENGMERKMRAAFHTLGCKVNTYETDAMEQMMRDGGYEIVPFDKGADVYIINTCSVTNMADHKSRPIPWLWQWDVMSRQIQRKRFRIRGRIW